MSRCKTGNERVSKEFKKKLDDLQEKLRKTTGKNYTRVRITRGIARLPDLDEKLLNARWKDE